MADLNARLMELLNARRGIGVAQSELYSLLNYSRSHVSETVAALEKSGLVIRKKDGRTGKRLWSREFFPGPLEDAVRVGFLRSSEYIPFLSSLHGVLEENSMELIARVYDSAISMISELHAKTIDMALAPTFTHVLFSMTMRPEVLVCTLADGGSAIMENTRPGCSGIMSSESSSMNLLIRDLPGIENMEHTYFVDPAEASREFLEGGARFIAIWEPYLSELSGRSDVHRVNDAGASKLLEPCCSAGVNKSFYLERSHLIHRIVSRYSELIRDPGADISAGLEIISSATGYSRDALEKSMLSYRYRSEISVETISGYMRRTGIPVPSSRIGELLSGLTDPV